MAAAQSLGAAAEGCSNSKRGAVPQPIEAAALPQAFLKIQTIVTVTGLSTSSIFRKTAAGDFPAPVKLGKRCTRWRSADLHAWLAAQGTPAKGE